MGLTNPFYAPDDSQTKKGLNRPCMLIKHFL